VTGGARREHTVNTRRYPAFLHGRIEDGNEHAVNVETRP
jgi:hypothetical protein